MGNKIEGNFIGTNAAGTARVPNFTGVQIQNASDNISGGTTGGARNVISGNMIGVTIINDPRAIGNNKKAEILPKAQIALKQAAAIIRDKARGAVRIEGHTDAKGSDAYNQKLSERRALAVKAWLADKEGLRNAQFLTQGFGARNPKAPNQTPDGADDPQGRQQNRRIEIIFKK